MELKHEGFSIREYVSRMRSGNVVKCWPFDASDQGSVVLPPITVKKFVWWLDDIEKLNKCLAPKPKSKPKPPKKRSISEIEQGFCINASKLLLLSNNYEEVNWGIKGKRKRKNKEIIVNNTKVMIKENDKLFQEKCFDFNPKYQEKKAIANSSSSHSRKNEENDIRDHVSFPKNKPRSHADHHVEPKSSIFENHMTRTLISPTQTAKCISPDTVQVNKRYGQHNKDKDVTLRSNRSLPFESLSKSHGINRGSQETRHLLYMGPRETPRHPNCIFPPEFSREAHYNHQNDDCVTLPLNSRGELIALSSTANSHRQANIDLVKTNHGNGNIISSTMRLMGKEFTVGGKGFQEDGHIWKDELRFSSGPMMRYRDDQLSLEKSRKTFLFPSEISQITNNYGIESRYPKNRLHNNNGSESFPFRDPFPFVSSSDIRLTNRQNLPRAPISAIGFPFTHPDLEQHVQSDWNRYGSGNGSRLLFDAPEKTGSTSNFQMHDNIGCTHRPYMLPGINFQIDSWVPSKNVAFGSYNSFSSPNSLTQRGWKSEENQGTNQVKNRPC